jgi:hypothetical protein
VLYRCNKLFFIKLCCDIFQTEPATYGHDYLFSTKHTSYERFAAHYRSRPPMFLKTPSPCACFNSRSQAIQKWLIPYLIWFRFYPSTTICTILILPSSYAPWLMIQNEQRQTLRRLPFYRIKWFQIYFRALPGRFFNFSIKYFTLLVMNNILFSRVMTPGFLHESFNPYYSG